MAEENLNNQKKSADFAQQQAKASADSVNFVRQLNTELRDSLNIRQRLTDQEKTLRDLGNSVVKAAQENIVELGKANKISAQISKQTSVKRNIEREIASISKNISLNSADTANAIADQIFELQDKVKQEQDIATSLEHQKRQRDIINKKLSDSDNLSKESRKTLNQQLTGLDTQIQLTQENLDVAQNTIGIQENKLNNLYKELGVSGNISDEDALRLASLISIGKAQEDNLSKLKQEDEIQKRINDRMGVSGALVEGTGALMQRLGMRSGIFQQAMQDARKEMYKLAEESERVNQQTGKIENNAGKIRIMIAGLSKITTGFGKALFDPLTITLKIVSVLSEVNKQAVDFTRQTGQSASRFQAVNSEISTAVDLMRIAADITKQTGLNAATVFTTKQISQISDAVTLLGLSAEQGTQLAMLMKQTGKSVEDIEKGVSDSTDAGISQRAVYGDILSASEDIVASTAGNEKALTKAASAARKLGLDLSRVNQIADGLLDFETSIENELQAQLLTGKQINLNKARELALNNDLEGVAEELAKNGASAAEFANMNRIQQQSLAKALGVSRQELGKMVLTEKAMSSMTEQQIADARGVTLEQSRQLSIQDKLQKSLFRLAEPFIIILDALNPIVSGLTSILKIPLAKYFIIAGVAVGTLGGKLKTVVSLTGSVVSGFSKMIGQLAAGKGLGFFSKLTGSVKSYRNELKKAFLDGKNLDKIRSKSGKLFDKESPQGKMIQNMKSKSTDKVQEASKTVSKKSGKGLSGITKTISKIDTKALLRGAAAMAVVAGSVFIFAKAVQQLEKIEDWGNIAIGLGAFAATMGVMGAVGKFAAPGITALGTALGSFGIAAAPAIPILLSIGGTAALIGAGFALIGAGAMMFGRGIEFAANGLNKISGKLTGLITSIPQLYLLGGALTTVAAGLGSIAGVGLLAIPALTILGTSLIPVATAFNMLGDSPIDSIVGKLSTLSSITPQLLGVGGALMSIAAGLSSVAVAGIAAIPALAALGTLAVMSAPLVALGGLFESDGDGEKNSEMIGILKEIRDEVRQGGDVYLDGNKVGEALVLGSYISS